MDYISFIRHKLTMVINSTQYETEILIVLTSGILVERRLNHQS